MLQNYYQVRSAAKMLMGEGQNPNTYDKQFIDAQVAKVERCVKELCAKVQRLEIMKQVLTKIGNDDGKRGVVEWQRRTPFRIPQDPPGWTVCGLVNKWTL